MNLINLSLHCSILLHEISGEVIHIDFGYAFDQGKLTLVPETVPFRLTRELVAPMGTLGVEGIFRKSSEITLQVMQKNQHFILAILEVLLYDPTYNWKPYDVWRLFEGDEHKRRQEEEPPKYYFKEINDFLAVEGLLSDPEQENVVETESNDIENRDEEASRIIDAISNKLNGIMDAGFFSVPGMVEQLINQASSANNLSKLFFKWCAFF